MLTRFWPGCRDGIGKVSHAKQSDLGRAVPLELPKIDARLSRRFVGSFSKNLDKDYEEGIEYGMIGYYVPHRVYPAGYHCDPKQPLPFAGLASQKNYMSLYLMCVYGNSNHATRSKEPCQMENAPHGGLVQSACPAHATARPSTGQMENRHPDCGATTKTISTWSSRQQSLQTPGSAKSQEICDTTSKLQRRRKKNPEDYRLEEVVGQGGSIHLQHHRQSFPGPQVNRNPRMPRPTGDRSRPVCRPASRRRRRRDRGRTDPIRG